MKKTRIISTDDILLTLCNSVTKVLGAATSSEVKYSAMVQKIHKTCLKPDIGCFVLFDGGFSGLVLMNFTAQAALEIYQTYMKNMGISESELATQHTSDEVANVMGELMNQSIGDFTGKIGQELQTSITQNQPKMLAINKQVHISVDTNLDRPQARRVTFVTARNNIFYLELAMDKTEFIQIAEMDEQGDTDPDSIIEEANRQADKPVAQVVDQDLFDELGL
ncbi:DUF3334 family protein [Celerinatantimonas sp. YJH-8]|uniref:DUF3334 family protein n=1 Tax=Celerinatantimonas sp. YJH-8 TaxID=3228714 RepID=UPI0038C962BE